MKSGGAVFQEDLMHRFYDDCAAERSLAGSTAATSGCVSHWGVKQAFHRFDGHLITFVSAFFCAISTIARFALPRTEAVRWGDREKSHAHR
ncbi:hypothetical protein EYC95_20045 [Pseudomonas sp. BGI-2]|nr:hypothetical protein EYC95_20045 [Pseudomonas sp. BGI-2]